MGPHSIPFYQGVCQQDKLTHDGREGNFCGLSRIDETLIKPLHIWIMPRCNNGWHIKRVPKVLSVNGFMADDVEGALQEIYAISRATMCRQFMFSLSLSPPQDAVVSDQIFLDAIQQAMDKLGLASQPHVVIFHEKNARRHCHVVISRIDTDVMKGINLSWGCRPSTKAQTPVRSTPIIQFTPIC